jgi:PKHD-type hydroxylase
MKGLWCYFLKKYSAEHCHNIIKRSEKYDFKQAVVGTDSTTALGVRRSQNKFILESDTEFKDIFDDLWLMAIEANQKFFNVHITRLPYIQIAKYEHTDLGEYQSHTDVFWLNNDDNYHRKLSCSIQLTDDTTYEGGNFEFTDLPNSQYPKAEDIKAQGTTLFFPSFVTHRVTPVTKGTRYSLVAWFEGPKWR